VGLDGVAGSAWDLGDQRAFVAEKRVEERRLAGVGPSSKDQKRALTEPLGRGRAGHQIADLRRGGLDPDGDPVRRDRAIVFLGKIDIVAQESLHVDERFSKTGQPPGQAALELAYGGVSLGRCGCVDQIAHGFGLDQIELAVENRAAGKLTRRRGASARGLECGNEAGGSQQAAVAGELYEVVSGIAMRRRKDGVDALIDGPPPGVMKSGQRRPPRGLGSKSGYHTGCDGERAFSTETDYR
jgi:hypothetical protein